MNEQIGKSESLSDRAARDALLKFNVLEGASLTLLSHRENAVYRVDRQGDVEPLALRVHRLGYQTTASIRSELQWMEALRAAGVFTPSPQHGADDDLVQTVTVDGEAFDCDLLSWVEGQSLEEIGDDNVYQLLGQINAKIHKHSESWAEPNGFTRQVWDEEGLFGEKNLWGHYSTLSALTQDQIGLLDQAAEKVKTRLAAYGKNSDRFGLIHADMMPENVLVKDNVPYVIDFDDSGYGWFMYDLATLLAFEIAEDDFNDRLNSWVEGYRQVRPLSDADLAELPTLIMCRFFTGFGWLESRKHTDMARDYTGSLVELGCMHAENFLAS